MAVLKGQCWLVLADRAPEALNEGDVILLSDTFYTVASDPGLDPSDGIELYASPATIRCGSESIATLS